MMRHVTRHLLSARGQTLVEFALIAPIFVILIAGIIDFAVAMDRDITLKHAVREGARYAAVTDDVGLVCDRVIEQAQGIVTGSDITISYEDINGDGRATDAGDSVKVTAHFTYDLPLIRPALSGLFGGDIGTIDMSPSGSAWLEKSVPGGTECPP
jgi:Flp pilus assembly protein TadG